MGQRRKTGRRSAGRAAHNIATVSPAQPATPWFLLGLAGVLVAFAAALMLVLHHLAGVGLPGCGPGSGCDEAARSIWGSIPIPLAAQNIQRWPVSFIGLAYFTAALGIWILTSAGLPATLRWIVRVGALASLAYLIIMLSSGYVCEYCLAAHAGNFIFWAAMERAARTGTGHRRLPGVNPVVASVLMFIVGSVTLGSIEWRRQKLAREKAEVLRRDSAQQILNPPDTLDARGGSPYTPEHPFTGRWRTGPEIAPIRIVIFSDYQCIDCERIETDVRRLVAERPDISLSAKHFPFCRPCNPALTRDMHPNACWAARAAETAGTLRGNEGFWQMHHWLFGRGGSFTSADITAGLVQMGYNASQFTDLMQHSDEVLKRVQADVEEARSLGIDSTPMIFINGVELRGWLTDNNAFRRTVDEVTAANPLPQSAEADQPPLAFEKYMEDWRQEPEKPIPLDAYEWSLGPGNAPVQLVMWGDYEEPKTAEADAAIREIVGRRGDVRYTFRHFPVLRVCNPAAQRDMHPNACTMARAAEAAGALGGVSGYWRMHAWLMANQTMFSIDALRAAANDMDLNPDSLLATMETPDASQAIAEDCLAGQQLNLTGVPMLYVNGRFVQRWKLQGSAVLERILNEAAGK